MKKDIESAVKGKIRWKAFDNCEFEKYVAKATPREVFYAGIFCYYVYYVGGFCRG